MSSVHISPSTGLPGLPARYFWKIIRTNAYDRPNDKGEYLNVAVYKREHWWKKALCVDAQPVSDEDYYRKEWPSPEDILYTAKKLYSTLETTIAREKKRADNDARMNALAGKYPPKKLVISDD